MSSSRSAAVALALAVWLAGAAPFEGAAQELAAVARLMTTKERQQQGPWWPRTTAAGSDSYLGSAACGECHGDVAARQRATAMARTLAPAASFEGAPGARAGSFALGPYRYELSGDVEGLRFTVTGGPEPSARSLAARIGWVLGAGETGYTYLFERDGVFHESRFSYFPTLGALASTPGRLTGLPASLEMAFGRPLSQAEARGCFSCHASGIVLADRTDPVRLEPGVTCEGCHGPGAEHAALHKSGLDGAGAIFHPGRLDLGGLSDFCGACHGTFWDLAVGPSIGLAAVRSPGYRLARSRCWGDGGDARLSCLSCHDPHGGLEPEPAAYDAACLACHGGAGSARAAAAGAGGATRPADAHRPQAPACPVAAERCVTCHMPLVELPQVHVESTDHWIRVVAPGEPFRD